MRRKVGNASPTATPKLTPRQLQIALMMADGLTAKEIAAQLDLSPKTVDFHRSEMYKTLGIKNTASLVRWLIRAGLLEP
jgi:DNA-binding CsgD family transcriptional regulator